MLGTRTVLGLAIDEFGIIAAELRVRPGRNEIRRTGQFTFEEEFAPENAEGLGQQLRRFLRTNHFSSKQVSIGIPAKWVLAKEIVVPPANPDALAGMLSIQVERAFSLNPAELIFDYCGRTSASEKSQVLLLAARRKMVDQIRLLAGAAGLQVQAVTVSALAFGKALSEAGPEQWYGLYTRPTYCEFWSQLDGRPRSIRHVPMGADNGTPDDYAKLLTSTIQRLILLSQDQSPTHQVTAYDACGVSDEIIDRLNEQLAPQTTITNGGAGLRPKRLGLSDHPEEAQSIAAAAVAMTAVGTDKPPVDFLNPRIGVKKTSGRKRLAVWGAIIGAACLVALGSVLADWQGDRTDIATYTQQLELMSEDVAAAQEIVDRVSYAGSWASQEPQFLDCLRELTLAFPQEPRVWATSLALGENGQGALVGKANDERSFYEVLDKIKRNTAFADVKMIHIRDVGRDSREKEFAVHFKFQGVR
jgi:hypothetical protein